MLPNEYFKKRNLITAPDGLKWYLPKPMIWAPETYDYTLEVGETLFSVGERLFGKNSGLWVLLMEINPVRKDSEWTAGDVVKLPKIVTVDTPSNISAKPPLPVKPRYSRAKRSIDVTEPEVCGISTLSIVNITETTVTFNIAATTGTVLGWSYIYSVDGGSHFTDPLITYTPQNTITGLPPDTTVIIRVVTMCAFNSISSVAEIDPITNAINTCPIPIFVPFNIQSTSLEINIGVPDSNTTYYVLEYRLFGASTWVSIQVPANSSGIGHVLISGLISSATYEFRSLRHCSLSDSDYAATQQVTLAGACGIVQNLTITAQTSNSVTFGWLAGVSNQRWLCTLINPLSSTNPPSQVVSAPTVTFSNLAAGNYTLTVTPDCSPCTPVDPVISIAGTSGSNNGRVKGVLIKTHNEFAGMTEDIRVTGTPYDSINRVYEQRVLKLPTLVKDDFQYMFENDFASFMNSTSESTPGTGIIPIDLFTAINGSQQNIGAVLPAVSPYALVTPSHWVVAGTTFSSAMKLNGRVPIVGTLSDTAVITMASKFPACRLMFNCHFINPDVNAAQQETITYQFATFAAFDLWCNKYLLRLTELLTNYNDLGISNCEAIVLKGLYTFLTSQSSAIRERCIKFLNDCKASLPFPVYYYADDQEWQKQNVASKGGYGCPIDEIAASFEAVMIKRGTNDNMADYITKSHFVEPKVEAKAVAYTSSYIDPDDNTKFVGHLSSRLLPPIKIQGSAIPLESIDWEPTVTYLGAGYRNNPYAYTDFKLLLGGQDFRTQFPAGLVDGVKSFRGRLRFRSQGSLVPIVEMIMFNIPVLANLQVGVDVDGKLYCACGTASIIIDGAYTPDTEYDIQFYITDTGGGTWNLNANGSDVGFTYTFVDNISGFPIFINTLEGTSLPSSYILRDYEIGVVLGDDTLTGGSYKLLDLILGVMTEWDVVKNNSGAHLVDAVIAKATVAGNKNTMTAKFINSFLTSPVPSSSNMKVYYDRLKDFNMYIQSLSEEQLSNGDINTSTDYSIDEDNQKTILANAVNEVDASASSIFIDCIDTRYHRQLKAKTSVDSVPDLTNPPLYGDATSYILGKQINGKKVIGFAGNIQTTIKP